MAAKPGFWYLYKQHHYTQNSLLGFGQYLYNLSKLGDFHNAKSDTKTDTEFDKTFPAKENPSYTSCS